MEATPHAAPSGLGRATARRQKTAGTKASGLACGPAGTLHPNLATKPVVLNNGENLQEGWHVRAGTARPVLPCWRKGFAPRLQQQWMPLRASTHSSRLSNHQIPNSCRPAQRSRLRLLQLLSAAFRLAHRQGPPASEPNIFWMQARLEMPTAFFMPSLKLFSC